MSTVITADYLRENPNTIFVFGDNFLRQGHGGAAALRDEPNTYGFITKVTPSGDDAAHFRPEEYVPIYANEVILLTAEIAKRPDTCFLISKIGAGLANRFNIFERIIEPTLPVLLSPYANVKFLWD